VLLLVVGLHPPRSDPRLASDLGGASRLLRDHAAERTGSLESPGMREDDGILNSMSKDVVVLCGMPSERAILAAAYPDNLILSGTDKNDLAVLVPAGTARIVSMGLCGGLTGPPPAVADVVLASSVSDGAGHSWNCDAAWNAAVIDIARRSTSLETGAWARPGVRAVPWFSSGVVDLADTRLQRADLFGVTGAWAIDDESYFAAVFCAERGIKFNVARSVSDDASETLPLAARGAIMRPDGSADIQYLFQSLATEGWAQDLDLISEVLPDYEASLATLQGLASGVVL